MNLHNKLRDGVSGLVRNSSVPSSMHDNPLIQNSCTIQVHEYFLGGIKEWINPK